MLPPYTYARGRLAEERARDVIREGGLARVMRTAKPVKHGRLDHPMTRFGDLLVSYGERLRAHHAARSAHLAESPLQIRR